MRTLTWEVTVTSMAKCKSCGAEIVWVEMPSGKAMPCDPAIIMYWASIKGRHTIITPNGETVRCELDGDLNNSTGVGYVPHWATCPNAAQHRRRK